MRRDARSPLVACILAVAGAFLVPASAHAELDLQRASVERLANGLTLIMLEDHSFPVVSTQVIYKSGSRDETAGKTGLAHFLEHLAFRASSQFPNAGATESIYDSGGEWHGYTWLDQTSYFSTMPKDGLDLLLRIEADRMARVTIDPAAIDAEKGAIITEMHSYENDPDSVLLDAVTATALQAHPYRNNTIGFEGDVRALTLEDARSYYERHYTPTNAVLAIVGNIDPMAARAMVVQHFAALPALPTPTRSNAVEPPQRGERRTIVAGAVERSRFAIAYPAPAASSPDYPAFLVLQQLLAGGSGVNFHQNDWGTPATPGAALHGVTRDLATWFVPTADRYVFVIKGSAPANAGRLAIEGQIDRRIAELRAKDVSETRIAAARSEVQRALVEDVTTTEDAAHQLAFFEGIGAYDALLSLRQSVAAVSAKDIRRLAATYLAAQQRTVGWMIPGKVGTEVALGAGRPQVARPRQGKPPSDAAASLPTVHRLSGGIPLIVQESRLSPTVTVQLLLSAPVPGEDPPLELGGLGTMSRSGLATELTRLLDEAGRAIGSTATPVAVPSSDPEQRLQQMIAGIMNRPPVAPRPMLLVISGAIERSAALEAAKRLFGGTRPTNPRTAAQAIAAGLRTERAFIARPLSQGALGYVVPAPLPGTRDGMAWRMLLYILAHDYSGRLGRSAIGERGLAYHIYSAYRSDGANAWATVWTGVDPDKADALEAELRSQLVRLAAEPPSTSELEAARRHLLGRDLSAAQGNSELASKLTRDFLETGGIRAHAGLEQALVGITPTDLATAASGFGRGTIVRVDVGEPRLAPPGVARGRR